MVKVAICEDQPDEAAALCQLLAQYEDETRTVQLQTQTFASAAELYDALGEGSQFDIYLLDVVMPKVNGIALARTLRSAKEKPVVIFTTSSKEFAVEAFSVRATDYLLKPVSQQALDAAMAEALKTLGSKVDVLIEIPVARGQCRVKLADVVCAQVQGHQIHYHLVNGSTIASKVLRIPFEEAAKDLVQDERFLQPFRSYLVNADHVERMGKTEMVLHGGLRVPISRLRLAQLQTEYMHYLSKSSRREREQGRGR